MPQYRILFNDINLPPLGTETLKSKRNLLVFSLLLFSLYYLDIKILKINALDMTLSIEQTARCAYLLIAIVIYELIAFCIRFYSDYSEWYTKQIASNDFEAYTHKLYDDDAKKIFKFEYIKSRIFGLMYSSSIINTSTNQNEYGELPYDVIDKKINFEFYGKSLKKRMLSFWFIELLFPVVFASISVMLNSYKYIQTHLIQLLQ